MDNNIRLHWEVGAPTFLVFLWQVTVWGIRSSTCYICSQSYSYKYKYTTPLVRDGGILVVMYEVSGKIRHGFHYLFIIFHIYSISSTLIKINNVGAVKLFCIQDNWKIRTIPTRDKKL